MCISIPCHRVTGKNGNMVGYVGLHNKVSLLYLEKQAIFGMNK
ncbi:MAG: MGMT family protein [Erysipelotrichaceae bacterium]|nr:MGMT family protein [Erysipelotrichaceae bacterium]